MKGRVYKKHLMEPWKRAPRQPLAEEERRSINDIQPKWVRLATGRLSSSLFLRNTIRRLKRLQRLCTEGGKAGGNKPEDAKAAIEENVVTQAAEGLSPPAIYILAEMSFM